MLLDRFGPTTTHALIWAGFDALLLVLLCLHVYWFYFIFRIAVRVRAGDFSLHSANSTSLFLPLLSP